MYPILKQAVTYHVALHGITASHIVGPLKTFFVVALFETGSHCVTLPGLELSV